MSRQHNSPSAATARPPKSSTFFFTFRRTPRGLKIDPGLGGVGVGKVLGARLVSKLCPSASATGPRQHISYGNILVIVFRPPFGIGDGSLGGPPLGMLRDIFLKKIRRRARHRPLVDAHERGSAVRRRDVAARGHLRPARMRRVVWQTPIDMVSLASLVSPVSLASPGL